MEKKKVPKITKITCPIHPKEKVARVSLNADSTKEIYCVECLLEFDSDRKKISNLKTIQAFLDEIEKVYGENSIIQKKRAELRDGVDPPESFISFVKLKEENLSKLVEHIETQKKKTEEEFQSIAKEVNEYILQKKEGYIARLDKQIKDLKVAYAFLEDKAKEAYPSWKGFETKQFQNHSVIERLNTVVSTQELIDFVKFVRSDLALHASETSSSSQSVPIRDQVDILLENFKEISALKPAFVRREEYKTELETLNKAVDAFLERGVDISDEIGELGLRKKKKVLGCGKCGKTLIWSEKVYGSGNFSCNRCYTSFTAGAYHCNSCSYDACKTCFERDSKLKEPSCSTCFALLEQVESKEGQSISCGMSCRSTKTCNRYYTCKSHSKFMCDTCCDNSYYE